MGLWPFSKKDDVADNDVRGAVDAAGQEDAQDADRSAADNVIAGPDPVHDAINGARGPFDGDTVTPEEFDFTDFADGILDLGSVQLAMPRGCEVQVEMGENGPVALHVTTPYGRLTPVAFSAPKSPGQWREAAEDIVADMANNGLDARMEAGPWGREPRGIVNDTTFRMIGVDGPRWMLRVSCVGPSGLADQLRELAHNVVARSFVVRGEEPMAPGISLPVVLPDNLAKQVRYAMENREEIAANIRREQAERVAQKGEQAAQVPSEDSALDQMRAPENNES